MRTVMTYPFKMFTGGRERFFVNIDFYNNFQASTQFLFITTVI
jgi:hypothetical protein